jgi:nucleoside-diphosphate-sugar epimerase
MTRRCLITGGHGFFGAFIARALREGGFDVLTPTRAELDVARAADWDRVAGELDSIVHAAAYVPAAGGSHEDVPQIADLAIDATHHALEFANRRGVRRFVYCSSANVYAPAPLPVVESASLDPVGGATYYALGKLWGEQLTRAFRAATKLSTVSLRVTAIHGQGMRPRGVVAAFFQRARDKQTLDVRAPTATGDYLYVRDAGASVVAALNAEAPADVYNIGSGRETTLLELANAIWAAVNPDLPPNINVGDATGGRFVLDITRAGRELAWSPRYDLAAGLTEWARA